MSNDSELDYEESNESQEPDADTAATRQPVADDDGLPLYEGVVYGVGAFLLSYVATLAMVFGALASSGIDVDDMAASYEIAGLTLLSSLGSGIEGDGDPISLTGAATGGSGGLSVLEIALPFFTIGVAAVLIAAAYSLSRYTGASDVAESVKTSLLVVPGWLVLTLAVAFLSSWETESEVAIELVTGDALLYAGIIFPVIFAVIGGLLARWPEPVDEIVAKIDG